MLKLGLWLLALCFVGTNTRAQADELLIGAAASLQDSAQKVAAAFNEQEAGARSKIRFHFGASSELVNQVIHRAPLDLVITADSVNMDILSDRQLLVPGQRLNLLTNQLALISPRKHGHGTLLSPHDLLRPEIKRIAVCAPEVPVGKYTRDLLQRLGLLSRLQSKFVEATNVRGALALVANAGADAGFVYTTDVKVAGDQVKTVYTAGPREGVIVTYPAAVVKDSAHQALARTFLQFLRSEAAAAEFKAAGFGLVSG